MSKTETIRFAAMADMHLDIMHDGMRRMKAFLKAAEEADVDFLIQLGDLSYPKDTSVSLCAPEKMPVNIKLAMSTPTPIDKDAIIDLYNSFPKPKYHLLGNHECDFCSKADAVERYGMENSYYAFHRKGWHFIVLDGNSYRDENGKLMDYHFGKYFETTDLPYMSEPQLLWLEKELEQGEEPVVMFCHQPINLCKRGLKNGERLQAIIQKSREKGRKIRLCMNGHTHVDELLEEDGILYYTVNSIAAYWAGDKYATLRYSKRTDERFPSLRYVVPYQKPVFAIVELSEEGIKVEGVKGRFVPPCAKSVGVPVKVTPHVKSWSRKWAE